MSSNRFIDALSDPETTHEQQDIQEQPLIEKKDAVIYKIGAHDVSPLSHSERQWHTGLKRRFPWIGLASLLGSLCGIIAVAVVLSTSNQKPRELWPAAKLPVFKDGKWHRRPQIQTNVMMTLLDVFTTICLGVAFAEGLAITWWRKAMRGSTVADLHRTWSFGFSLREILTAGKHFNLIALFALAAKLTLLNGILLQEAAKTRPGMYNQTHAPINLSLVRELPFDYTGKYRNDSQIGSVSFAFSWDIWRLANGTIFDFNGTWAPQTDYSLPFDTGCIGVCNATFEGFGFAQVCYPPTPMILEVTHEGSTFYDAELTDRSTTYNASVVLLSETRFVPANTRARDLFPKRAGVFESADGIVDQYPFGTIASVTGFSSLYGVDKNDTSTCSGEYQLQFCSYQPAVVRYEVQIINSTQIGGEKATDSAGVAAQNVFIMQNATADTSTGRRAYDPYDPQADDNLRAIATFLHRNYDAEVWMFYSNATGQGGYVLHHEFWSPMVDSYPSFDAGESCELFIDPPNDYISWQLAQLTLIASMHAAAPYKLNDNVTNDGELQKNSQTFNGSMLVNTVVYDTDWKWGGAALGFMTICFLFMIPNYWGFWELGRKVSLDAVEIASAFQAPILEDSKTAGHGPVRTLVSNIGNRPVQYGQIVGQEKLAMARPEEVESLTYSLPVSTRSWNVLSGVKTRRTQ